MMASSSILTTSYRLIKPEHFIARSRFCTSLYELGSKSKFHTGCLSQSTNNAINVQNSGINHKDPHVGPLKHYSSMLEKGLLKPDKNQFAAVNRLQLLYNDIQSYRESLHSGTKPGTLKVPKGLYLHGEVGTGKTVLLDLMFHCLPDGSKKRVHFHNFLLHLYSVYNKWNLCHNEKQDEMIVRDPLDYIADQILHSGSIICFDEIQVADYGSCSLLHGVFNCLFSKGAIVIGTSNRSIENLGDTSLTESNDGEHPMDDPFESVRSFKTLLQSNCTSVHLNSQDDYRSSMQPGNSTYFCPINDKNEERLDKAFSQLIGSGRLLGSEFISVYGRKVLIPIASKTGVARFTARELFEQPLGPADYIQICNNYHSVFIDRISKMTMQQRNQARRFLSFIDAAYESRTKVYCTAESYPEELFTMLPKGDDSVDDYNDQMHFEMIGEIAYDLALSEFDFRSLGIITGEDEIFSFRRAVSRLKEMQSLLYQMRPHITQEFHPFTGTSEDRIKADERRRKRMQRRKQHLEELEKKKNMNDEFAELRNTVDDSINAEENEAEKESTLDLRFKDLDWGDEASYRTWSQTVSKKHKYDETVQKLLEKVRGKEPALRMGKEHVWGFGWWEKAIKRIKGNDPDAKK